MSTIDRIRELDQSVRRGDVFFASRFDPDDPKDHRPVIIISNDRGNRSSNRVNVVPVTSDNGRLLGTHVKIVCRELSTALCERVTSIPKTHLEDYVRTLSDSELAAIEKAVLLALGISVPTTTEPVPAAEEAASKPEKVFDEEKNTLRAERDAFKELCSEFFKNAMYREGR